MGGPRLSFITGRRYATKFLLTSEVEVEGFDVEYVEPGMHPFAGFRDMATTISYDIGEQAFSHYVIAKDRGKPLMAIPVFTSRFFPHLGITVNRESGIQEPRDLAGKRVGVFGFAFNPAVWARGILLHQYSVPVDRITWVEDEEDMYGLKYPWSDRFTIERARFVRPVAGQHDRALQVEPLLESGEIDAFIAPTRGRPVSENTRRLFDDPYKEIEAYYHATSVFPINTLVTLKETVVEAHPELPKRLMQAFREASLRYQADVLAGTETEHLGLDPAKLREMGLFPDQYGLEPNYRSIRMMIQYCYEQELISKLYEPEELFVTV